MSSPHHGQLKLVIYPGEAKRGDGVTIGTIYVVGGLGEKSPMAGGPPPGKGYQDRGGHSAGQTPTGTYTLDHAEHHTTQNWPGSVIPWGAKLREEAGEVQYEANGKWYTATGANGRVVSAARLFVRRDGQNYTDEQLDEAVRVKFLYGPDG